MLQCEGARSQSSNSSSCHPSPSRSRHQERTKVIVIQTNGDRRWGALVTTQPATTVLKLQFQLQAFRWMEQPDRTGGQPVSSGVKRDARTAELPDEYEQGGKFLQVEGLTTVDAEEIPCEFSVEDDFVMDENTEGSTRNSSRPSWQARRRSLTRWRHSESLTCAKNCQKMQRRSQRDGKTFRRATSGDAD